MRIEVDRVRCEGHGLCEERAPEIFHLEDDGELLNRFEDIDLPPELEAAAAGSVGVCPIAALKLLGGTGKED